MNSEPPGYFSPARIELSFEKVFRQAGLQNALLKKQIRTRIKSIAARQR
jgi:hypothetical protein